MLQSNVIDIEIRGYAESNISYFSTLVSISYYFCCVNNQKNKLGRVIYYIFLTEESSGVCKRQKNGKNSKIGF